MKTNESQILERILESAVIVSWADLMRGAQAGLVHIEYGLRCGRHFGLPEVLVIQKPRSFGFWRLSTGRPLPSLTAQAFILRMDTNRRR